MVLTRKTGAWALGLALLALTGLLVFDRLQSSRRQQALQEARRLWLAGDHAAAEQLLAPFLPDEPRAVELKALILEARGDLPGCRALLEPLRDTLDPGSEGARVLGLAALRRAAIDDARALLTPYLDIHLQRLREAQQRVEIAWRAEDARLRQELASAGPQQAARQALLADSLALRREVHKRLEARPELKTAVEAASAQQGLLNLLTELGVGQLMHAQNQVESAARLRALQTAQSIFASVSDMAGHPDVYYFYAGLVSYWLGDSAAGRALFEQLLAQSDDLELRLTLATRLQRFGDRSWAARLFEEAWQAAQTPELRHEAAHLRALAETSELTEKVLWLERADPAATNVQTALQTARGELAELSGELASAESCYTAALKLLEGQEENATQLNNRALVFLSLARLRADKSLYELAIADFERAVRAAPQEPSLLRNAARQLLDAALRDLLQELESLDLHVEPRLQHLAFLYQDSAQRSELIGRLAEHPALHRAFEFFARLRVLSPSDPMGYQCAGLLAYLDDQEALQGMLEQLEGRELDLTGQSEQLAAFYAGRVPESWRSVLRESCQKLRSAVSEASSKPQRQAFAACQLVGQSLSLSKVGDPVAADSLVAWAESAATIAHSAGAEATLMTARMFRAARRLKPLVPGAAPDLLQILGSGPWLAWALARDPALRERARAEPDLEAALDQLATALQRFPDDCRLWEWALLTSLRPELAEQAAQAIAADDSAALLRRIDRRLAPQRATTGLNHYWELQLAGQSAAADSLLHALRARGIPLQE